MRNLRIAIASKVASAASALDDNKSRLPKPLIAAATWVVDQLHDAAQTLLGADVDAVYCAAEWPDVSEPLRLALEQAEKHS